MNSQLAEFVLRYFVDMFQLLQRHGYKPKEHNNMFCPFHYNVHTPSAKMYHDKYGWCLWCFNEQRLFTTYDVYEKLLGIDPIVAANIIWNKLTPEQQQKVQEMVGNQEDFEGDVPFMSDLDDFSQGKISYQRLCDMIALKL